MKPNKWKKKWYFLKSFTSKHFRLLTELSEGVAAGKPKYWAERLKPHHGGINFCLKNDKFDLYGWTKISFCMHIDWNHFHLQENNSLNIKSKVI